MRGGSTFSQVYKEHSFKLTLPPPLPPKSVRLKMVMPEVPLELTGQSCENVPDVLLPKSLLGSFSQFGVISTWEMYHDHFQVGQVSDPGKSEIYLILSLEYILNMNLLTVFKIKGT